MLSAILRHCQRDTPKPATDNKSTAVTAEPPTTPQPPASALLILGDPIVKSLGTNGMEKLTKKSTTIITTGGATPTTLPLHESTATATDIVLHVGTNSVNSSTEQPDAIADIIMERADCIRTTNAGADIHISSIIQRSDLVDENESTTTANEKILSTNELLKKKCTKANMKFIDNSNIEHNDLYDGLHMNTTGGLKLAKNIARSVNGTSSVTPTTPNGDAFKTRRPRTFGKVAGVRRRQPAAGNQQSQQSRPHDRSSRRLHSRDESYDRYRPASDRLRSDNIATLNNDWPTLPRQAREVRGHRDQRYATQQQTDFVNALVNTLLNSCPQNQY